MSSTTPKTQTWIGEKYREYYRWKKYFGGAVKVKEVLRTDSLGSELHIAADPSIKVFLNGRKLAPESLEAQK